MRNTRIIATLGPATADREVIRRLVRAGVDVFRLNASHGSVDEHFARLKTVREISHEENEEVGILLDLQGPKIRLGVFEGGNCTLATGQTYTITTAETPGNAERASTSYADFAKDVKSGDRVLLNDGAVELRVLKADGVSAVCLVVRGGVIGDHKGINLPGVAVSTPALTKKDKADLRALLPAGIDMVALSFVRRPDDLLRLRHFLDEQEVAIPIIAKIEKPEAWDRLDDILAESDGVMIARGDLGVEMALEKVPFIQKRIIERARERGRFAITATQMLESMIENAVPTRAEVSDVANAIYDGTDAVMLSAETSVGKYPVEAVEMMARVAQEAEASFGWRQSLSTLSAGKAAHSEIIANAAYHAARTLDARSIVVFTKTGSSARLVARYRPPVPIIAFTNTGDVARQLQVIYGTRALIAPDLTSTDEMLGLMDRCLLERGWVKPGDSVVFVAGQPIGIAGTTNMMRLRVIN